MKRGGKHMELTKEYFDKELKLTREHLDEKLERFATKEDLTTALQSQTKELQDYTDQVASSILDAVDAGFAKADSKLEELARTTADGFIDVINRLDVRERTAVLEKDVKIIKRAINL